MAKYYGYVTLPTDTYDNWKNAVNGNGYDFDSTYGCQCYDLAVEFWWNIGFPQGYPVSYTGNAYDIWTYREQNASYNGVTYFDLITDPTQIQKGDIIVFNQFSGNPYGHVGFADVNYSDGGWTYPELPILSQNNGGTPDPSGGAYTNVHGYNITLFLGAFRFRDWHTTPPTPVVSSKRETKRFPWVLYANKLRNKY